MFVHQIEINLTKIKLLPYSPPKQIKTERKNLKTKENYKGSTGSVKNKKKLKLKDKNNVSYLVT